MTRSESTTNRCSTPRSDFLSMIEELKPRVAVYSLLEAKSAKVEAAGVEGLPQISHILNAYEHCAPATMSTSFR